MPVYEYRCRTCDDVFELTRPMSQSSEPAACPAGHEDAVKLLSRVLVLGRSGGEAPLGASGSMPSGGGCCGGACGCH